MSLISLKHPSPRRRQPLRKEMSAAARRSVEDRQLAERLPKILAATEIA